MKWNKFIKDLIFYINIANVFMDIYINKLKLNKKNKIYGRLRGAIYK